MDLLNRYDLMIKMDLSKKALDVINKLNVEKSKVYGIGDSIHDVRMLSLAGHKFGIDPKGDFKEYVDIAMDDDISKVIKYL